MTTYGYARVSTEDQNLTVQREALTAAGAQTIYEEKESGARSDREQLLAVIAALQPGDVLLVTRLDRMARSLVDLLNILDTIGKHGAMFKSLAEPWADATSPYGKLLVSIIGSFAEFERHLIKARTNEGRKRAKADGVVFGRPKKLSDDQRREIVRQYESNVGHKRIAFTFGVHPKSVVRIARQARREMAGQGISPRNGFMCP